jgi:Tol biopolymer transport system component
MRRAALTAALALAALAAPADAAVDDTILVTRAGLDGPVADRGSQYPSISADGRIVTFDTEATTLGGPPGFYAKDLQTGVLQRLDATDARSPSQQPRLADSGAFACFVGGPGAHRVYVRQIGGAMALRDAGSAILAYEAQNTNDFDATAKNCDVTDDGDRVVFSTMRSRDPVDADGSGRSAADVYVHDFTTGADILVSRTDGPSGDDGDDYSVAPEISPDGRYVLFRSRADNLSAENDDAVSDLYVRDLVENRTTWVSRADGPAGGPGAQGPNPGNATSGSPAGAMSDDGRFVAFQTFMRGLDPASIGTGSAQVLVRDLAAGTTRNAAVSRDPDGNRVVLNGNNNNPTINADGTLVGFGGANSSLDPTVSVAPNTRRSSSATRWRTARA